MGYAHWNQDFSRCGAENGLSVAHQLREPFSTAWTHLKTKFFPTSRLIRCYANAHTYGIEGYPHTDSKRPQDTTAVIYLNRDWLREWGGETMVYDGNTILHAELPDFNTGLVFPSNMYHTARSVSRICSELRVTLMFKMTEEDCDPTRDRLQTFLETTTAVSTKHNKTTLMAHLLRVYDLLKLWDYSTDVCVAGGLHSIFGTNRFTSQTMTPGDRSSVVDIAGEYATELVELFSVIDRPQTLELSLKQGINQLYLSAGGTITVSDQQLKDLCAIEAANLRDQNALKSYENISKFVK